MTDTARPSLGRRAYLTAAASRAAGFSLLWAVLMPSLARGDVAVGVLSVVAATAVSLHLLSPECGGLRFGRMLALMPHYLAESVRAGVDVALRAFSPAVRVSPGYLAFPVALAPGLSRNTFSSITSLLPGTVPCGIEPDGLVYHCLDISQPVLEQLAAEERRLATALQAGSAHD